MLGMEQPKALQYVTYATPHSPPKILDTYDLGDKQE